MSAHPMAAKAEAYLRRLCVEIPSRPVGSWGNRAATDFFAEVMESRGFQVESFPFDCFDWREDGVDLAVDGECFEAFASPYSLGCDVRATLRVVSTVEELAAVEAEGSVLLLHGELTKGQLMPKNFPFYNPEEHQRIIRLLEEKQPRAIIAATSRDVDMVGSQYPFPLMEDGDFDIASVYMTDKDGARLAAYAGKEVSLVSRAQRMPSGGCNVIARKGRRRGDRAVLFAHIDSRIGSPGALDNASGVTVLLLLAELLVDYCGSVSLEFVAMNGEDYYSNPGEQQWLRLNESHFDEVVLGINIDDVGYVHGRTAYSLYGCPDDLAKLTRGVMARHVGLVEGEPWYQGDHGLFLMHKRPAVALTAEKLHEVMSSITHTARDTIEMVAPEKLVEVTLALRDLLLCLDGGSR